MLLQFLEKTSTVISTGAMVRLSKNIDKFKFCCLLIGLLYILIFMWLNYHHLYYFWLIAEHRPFDRVPQLVGRPIGKVAVDGNACRLRGDGKSTVMGPDGL